VKNAPTHTQYDDSSIAAGHSGWAYTSALIRGGARDMQTILLALLPSHKAGGHFLD
jgi:hypothetical protein